MTQATNHQSIPKNLQEKKVTKNAIGHGSFRIGQFFHKRYNKNTNHPSIQQSLQEKRKW
jgi:hypothetical protein